MSETGAQTGLMAGGGRLESWKEIASYLNRDVRTVQRWEKSEGLPVHRHLHDRLGTVYAFKHEIDDWWHGRRVCAQPPGEQQATEQPQGVEPDAQVSDSAIVQNGGDDPLNGGACDSAANTRVAAAELTEMADGSVTVIDASAIANSPAPEAARGEGAQNSSEDITTKANNIRRRWIWSALAVLIGLSLYATVFLIRRGGLGKTIQGTSVAVLPFSNLNSDTAQEYFSDGMTEELITELGRQDGSQLRVVALGSSLGYKNTDKRPKQIARELGVDYLLGGTVRRSGERIRVSVHLVRGSDEAHIWDESYDRDVKDVLALQSELAESIERNISVRLTVRRPTPRTVKPEAYEAYLKGRFFWNKRTPADLVHALEYFKQATAIDKMYAPAYVGMADCYALLGSAEFGAIAPNTAMPLAKQAVSEALGLDNSLAEAHASLAHIRLVYDWDFAGAEREFRQAIALNPQYATAHQWYALYFNARGRTADALEQLRLAEQLDPLSPTVKSAISEAYYFNREYDQAAAAAQRALEMDPNFVLALVMLARARELQGRYDEAISLLEKADAVTGGHVPALSTFRAHAYALKGDVNRADQILHSLLILPRDGPQPVYVPALYVASIYGAMGNKGQAFAYLRLALQERCEYLIYLDREPLGDSMRNDPRYKAVLREVGLR